jgi:hypothetical protein
MCAGGHICTAVESTHTISALVLAITATALQWQRCSGMTCETLQLPAEPGRKQYAIKQPLLLNGTAGCNVCR